MELAQQPPDLLIFVSLIIVSHHEWIFVRCIRKQKDGVQQMADQPAVGDDDEVQDFVVVGAGEVMTF